MEQKIISEKESKKRKMFLVLPLLTLPFITILFYTLGGGRAKVVSNTDQGEKGFNFTLPIPKFKEDSALDKMSYYDQAAVDSLKRLELIKKDPNYLAFKTVEDSLTGYESAGFGIQGFKKGATAFNSASFQDRNEQKVYEKLKALQSAINQPDLADQHDMREFENYGSSKTESEEIKKLEGLMSAMNTPPEGDPELQQLGGMLENILDIQHPQRIEQRLKETSEKDRQKKYSVQKKNEDANISSLQENIKTQSFIKTNEFYSLDEDSSPEEIQNSIEAVIHQTQTIINGSLVKLRLTQDIFLQGTVIPKNNFLYGTATLKGERLEVKINTIQFKNSIFPVDLAVYDIDGMDGIYIPGAIGRDAAKSSADRSIQTLGLTGISDSWGAQAAGMGIEAAKSLMSKKVKLVKVVVKAGYKVLLYDEKQKN